MEASKFNCPQNYDYSKLVRQAQNGDRLACEQLVKASTKLVKKLTYASAGREHCEDAYQETYLIAFKKLRQLKSPEAFPSWISRIALHVCYDLKKKEKSEEELPDKEASPDHAQTVADSVTIQKALSQLHRKDRDVILLREFLQLSYDQVASTLRVPVGTVRSRLHKARTKLVDRLKARG